jgi:hypothetical protein
MGRALSLPFIAMTAWSDRWLAEGSGPFALRSKSTGQKLSVALVDESGRRARPSDIETVINPRFKRDTSVPG